MTVACTYGMIRYRESSDQRSKPMFCIYSPRKGYVYRSAHDGQLVVLLKTAVWNFIERKACLPIRQSDFRKFGLVKNKGLTQGIRTQIPPYFPFQCMMFPSKPEFLLHFQKLLEQRYLFQLLATLTRDIPGKNTKWRDNVGRVMWFGWLLLDKGITSSKQLSLSPPLFRQLSGPSHRHLNRYGSYFTYFCLPIGESLLR